MSTGIIFITAPNADPKVVNRLLLYLQDRQYGSDHRFRVITTGDSRDDQFDYRNNDVTEPGDITSANWNNPWAGATLSDVTRFCLNESLWSVEDDTEEEPRPPCLFLVLDEQGVRNQTIILCEKLFDHEETEVHIPDGFKKVRAPWHGVYMMWCNLDIANMGFEDYCKDQQYIPDDEGWYKPGEMLLEDDMDEEFRNQRNEEIEKLEKERLE